MDERGRSDQAEHRIRLSELAWGAKARLDTWLLLAVVANPPGWIVRASRVSRDSLVTPAKACGVRTGRRAPHIVTPVGYSLSSAKQNNDSFIIAGSVARTASTARVKRSIDATEAGTAIAWGIATPSDRTAGWQCHHYALSLWLSWLLTAEAG